MSTPTARNNLKQIFKKIAETKRTEHPWVRGEPYQQCYYTFDNGSWTEVSVSKGQTSNAQDLSSITVMSWNVDFMRVLTQERMIAALRYLQRLIDESGGFPVVMLNEMLESDLELIQNEDWVRRSYYLTDVSRQYWESGFYGM